MALARELFGNREAVRTSVESSESRGLTKADITRELEGENGRHLVFVHDLGCAKNRELIAAYTDRRAWRVSLRKDQRTTRLESYPDQHGPADLSAGASAKAEAGPCDTPRPHVPG